MATALSAPVSPAQPAPAVEVVTSLGASVVSVDTLTTAATGRRRGALTLAAGLALLTLALATFGYGVRAAAHDATARARWIAEKRPAWAFRPTRHGAGVDAAALVGVCAGLGLVAAGLLQRSARPRTALRVGQNSNVDIPLADAPASQTLVEASGGGFVTPLDGLDGDVAFGGTSTSLAAMRAAGHVALPLYVGTAVRTKVGNASFFLRGIEAPARSAPPVLGRGNVGLAFIAASAVAHLGLWGLMQTATDDQEGAPTDMSLTEASSDAYRLVSTEDVPPPPPEDGDADADGMTGEATAPTATALDDGTLGHDQPNANPAKLQVANRDMSPQLARKLAIEEARTAGILSADVFQGGPISVADGRNLASGFDSIDFTGGFDGDGTGAPAGSFGWGVRGTGTGCGTLTGVPCGGIASDPFATLGKDDGKNYLGTLGDHGPGGPRRRTAAVPVVKIQPPTVCGGSGCLDKEVIRRYIRRNIAKISYCYEKELLAKPGLEGTVTATFTLNGNGRVVESRASGVDPTVSSCIAQVISNVEFPKVGDTGLYPIKYPFQLRPRG
ncbi:MAG: AgmX/PglI C-terminal domain-containing protein [Kofleriaceae bacterium]